MANRPGGVDGMGIHGSLPSHRGGKHSSMGKHKRGAGMEHMKHKEEGKMSSKSKSSRREGY